MNKLTITVIPHTAQRYNTCGDWYYDDAGNLHICVSDLGDWRYNMLIGLHEAVEALLCKRYGVSQEAVDKFDMDEVDPDFADDPGSSPKAPYHPQHVAADAIERLVAIWLQVERLNMDKAIDDLPTLARPKDL